MNDVNNNSVSHAFVETTERNSMNNIAKRRSSSDLNNEFTPHYFSWLNVGYVGKAQFAESSAVMDEDDQDDVMKDVDVVVLATVDSATPERNVLHHFTMMVTINQSWIASIPKAIMMQRYHLL